MGPQEIRVIVYRPERHKVHSLFGKNNESYRVELGKARRTKYPVKTVKGRQIIVATVRRRLKQDSSLSNQANINNNLHYFIHLI